MIQVKHVVVLALIGTILLTVGCVSTEPAKKQVRVIYAGSLIIPFTALETAFERANPDVDVLLEGHGSIQAIRHITELQEEYDVLAVADESLIPDMMYPSYADWYVRFAQNQVVIAYTNQSLYADELNASNWYEILARPEVSFGFSNPMFDACGYRTLMVIQLVELYYHDDQIFEELIARQFDPPMAVLAENGTYTVLAPEVFEPKGDKLTIRGGSVQLLAMLEYGGIDYAFEYKSVAEQHGLRYLELPAEIDLRSPELRALYETVRVRLGFQRFTSVGIDRVGIPIYYGITVPKNAPNPDLGVAFVHFMLSEEGQNVLREVLHPPSPAEADALENVPDDLRDVVVNEIANRRV